MLSVISMALEPLTLDYLLGHKEFCKLTELFEIPYVLPEKSPCYKPNYIVKWGNHA